MEQRRTLAGVTTAAGMQGPVWGIVLAGGGGSRFGGAKQYADLGGITLLDRTVMTAATVCDGIVVVLPESARATTPPAPQLNGVEVRTATGGARRADSVRAGLAAVPAESPVIVVADAAHPLATPALYARVIDAVRAGADGAIPGLPLTEAVTTVSPAGDDAPPGTLGTTGTTVPAAGRVLVQTPHAFRAVVLRSAHATGADAVEDSALVAATGGTVVVVPGDPANLHVTTPEELELARLIAAVA
jgi:2-C-methyl-D-erythritol 4-phosphate cytidylyltransferase